MDSMGSEYLGCTEVEALEAVPVVGLEVQVADHSCSRDTSEELEVYQEVRQEAPAVLEEAETVEATVEALSVVLVLEARAAVAQELLRSAAAHYG